MRNDYRNQNENSDRGQGPQGNGNPQNGNGYHQSRSGYHQNGNGYHQNGGNQQRRPYSNGNGNGNGNGRVERNNGPKQQTPAPAAS
jgi:hypothetical protein